MKPADPLVFAPSDSGRRLDQYLAEQIDSLSRTRIRDLILAGNVRVGGRLERPAYRVQVGDQVRVELPAPVPCDLVPEEMPLAVIYEDDDMLVIDKPPGIAVHPAPGHREHTLVHALLARYPNLPGIGGTQRPGIVHRLDLDTSGLLMVAKTDNGLRSLATQLESRAIKKGYVALLRGTLREKRGVIDAPIARHPVQRQQMAIVTGGRSARTRYRELADLRGFSLVLAMPETGRTHQLRVHFAALGLPVVGDSTYGGSVDFLRRQFLHAGFLRFARPLNGEPIALRSALPDDLSAALSALLLEQGTPRAEVDRQIRQMLRLAEKHFHSEVS